MAHIRVTQLYLDNFVYTYVEYQPEFIQYSFSEEHLRANISDPDYRCEFVQIL